MNVPVIMLSATLPNQKKKNYINSYLPRKSDSLLSLAYPLISYVTAEGKIHEQNCNPYRKSEYSVHLLKLLNDIDGTVGLALSLIGDGGNLCLMANTVYDAQRIYSKLKQYVSKKDNIELMLYHARFTASDRAEIEKQCISRYSGSSDRPVKSILVCTQVVEQSLDVDFDILITQICPIDLLIQRLGREWRHNLNRPTHITKPETFVLTGDMDKTPMRKIYSKYIIEKTEQYLTANAKISIPDSLRNAISFVYDGEDFSEAYYEKYFLEMHQENAAKGVMLTEPEPEEYYLLEDNDIFSEDTAASIIATTRIGLPSCRIILCTPELREAYSLNPSDKKIINELLNNMVSLPCDIPYDYLEQEGIFKGMYLAVSDTNTYNIAELAYVEYDKEIGVKIINRRF